MIWNISILQNSIKYLISNYNQMHKDYIKALRKYKAERAEFYFYFTNEGKVFRKVKPVFDIYKLEFYKLCGPILYLAKIFQNYNSIKIELYCTH